MTKDRAASLISSRFGDPVEVLTLEVKPWVMRDHTTGGTWRDHLMAIFTRRLSVSLAHGHSGHPVEEMKRLLSVLECQTENQPLHSFSARSERFYYSGWMVGDQVAYCIPSEKDAQL
jgi:hypothetical protein